MGCDIHIYAEKKYGDEFVAIPNFEPFGDRSYGVFAFLACVRNYSGVEPIAEARGLPADASNDVRTEYQQWEGNAHTPSWLLVSELASFDYDATIEDRRYTQQIGPNVYDGGATCEPGRGKIMTWREFLGGRFFSNLESLKALGADRVVFWFDN